MRIRSVGTRIEGVPVRIFEPAKTVADCFKFRNTVGLEVALDALRECLRDRRATVDELLHFASICRVERTRCQVRSSVVVRS